MGESQYCESAETYTRLRGMNDTRESSRVLSSSQEEEEEEEEGRAGENEEWEEGGVVLVLFHLKHQSLSAPCLPPPCARVSSHPCPRLSSEPPAMLPVHWPHSPLISALVQQQQDQSAGGGEKMSGEEKR